MRASNNDTREPQTGRGGVHAPAVRRQSSHGLRLSARGAALILVAALGFAPFTFFTANSTQAGGEIREWAIDGFPEPSGVVYHPTRNTLFVVGDEGDVAEVDLDGNLLKSQHLGGDLEGIACDPSTGMLYLVREGHEIILELTPDDFEVRRRFTIDRTFDNDPNYLRRGGDGIEGITFVPDETNGEGGSFYAVNQYDPAILLKIDVPLRSSGERFETVRISEIREVATGPLSGIVWSQKLDGFLIISALWRKVYVTDADGVFLRGVRVPGLMPEGLALLPDGSFVIAQDTGGLLLWKPERNPFEGVPGEETRMDEDDPQVAG